MTGIPVLDAILIFTGIMVALALGLGGVLYAQKRNGEAPPDGSGD